MAVSFLLSKYYENKLYARIEAFSSLLEENEKLVDSNVSYIWRKGSLWKRQSDKDSSISYEAIVLGYLKEGGEQFLTATRHAFHHLKGERVQKMSHIDSKEEKNVSYGDEEELLDQESRPSSIMELTSLQPRESKSKIEDMFGVDVPVQVFTSMSLFTIFLVLFDNFLSACCVWLTRPWLTIEVLYIVGLASSWLYFTFVDSKTTDEEYHGFAMNRILNMRCDAGPSRFLRSFPSLYFGASTLFKLSGLFFFLLLPDKAERIIDCALVLDEQDDPYICEGIVFILVFCASTTYFGFSMILFFTTMRGDLTKEAQAAILWEATIVEKFSETTELLLMRAEICASRLYSFKAEKPFSFFLLLSMSIGFGITFVVTIAEAQETYFGSVQPVVFLPGILLAAVSSTFMFIYGAIAYAVWASFHSSFLRMRILSDYLQVLLRKTVADMRAIQAGKLSVEEMKNPVQELHAWMKARAFYADLVVLLGNRLGSWPTAANLIVFVCLSILSILQLLPYLDKSPDVILANSWSSIMISTVLIVGLIIPLNKGIEMFLEFKNQRQMLRAFAVEYEMSLYSFSLYDREREGSEVEDVFHVVETVTNMADLLEQQDEPPYVLGIPITPLLINSLIGYILTAFAGLVLYALQL